MEQGEYKKILENAYEKAKGASRYSDWKEWLTDEELAMLAVHETNYREELGEEDECLAKDILLLLKASRRSARHSLLVLEKVKDALLHLSFPMR